MADLKTAGKRFDKALTHLEASFSKWAESGNQSTADWTEERQSMQSELGTLKKDYANVSAECTELRQQNDALARVAGTVSDQLDATIGELAELLDG